MSSKSVKELMSNLIFYKIKINYYLKHVSIQADKLKLESMFSNLIINAIQAMESKRIITIKISDELNDFVTIEVGDNGSQIPEENFGKIFEALFTTKLTGTGLGLASCKNIIEQHKGTISVTNNPVTFKIILPKRVLLE